MRKSFISFIVLLMLAWIGIASAADPYTPTRKQFNFATNSAWVDDAGAACSTFAAVNAASSGLNWKITSAPVAPSYRCGITLYFVSNGAFVSGPNYYDANVRLVCDDGSLPNSSGLCTDVKTPKCDAPAGSVVTWSQITGHAASGSAVVSDPSSRSPYPSSSPSCGIDSVPSVVKCYSVAASGGGKDFYCQFSAVSNGTNAPAASAPVDAGAPPTNSTPTSTSAPADAKGNCPGGTVQGGVDSGGTPICIGSGTNSNQSSSSSVSTSPTTTTTASDGTKTSTSSQSTTNSDGSVTVKTTTTVTGTDGTVKTTTSTSTGNNPTGGGGKDDNSKDFCTANPGLTICQNSSVSGTCGQTACQGDAIQCATLRAAAAMQCAQQQDTDAVKAMPQKALGDQIMAGADPMAGQIADTLKGTDVDMSHVSFDQSGFLGGGTCLANRSFVVMGRVVPVDFTTVCNNIAPLRAVMMAVALIMSYLIVGRSVVGS